MWQGSLAQALLQADIEAKKHKQMKPKILYESKAAHHENYSLDFFRDRIYQEEKARKCEAYLEEKREKKEKEEKEKKQKEERRKKEKLEKEKKEKEKQQEKQRKEEQKKQAIQKKEQQKKEKQKRGKKWVDWLLN